jgi:hypothetical protein
LFFPNRSGKQTGVLRGAQCQAAVSTGNAVVFLVRVEIFSDPLAFCGTECRIKLKNASFRKQWQRSLWIFFNWEFIELLHLRNVAAATLVPLQKGFCSQHENHI